ncbi:MAG: hypothetical protein J6Y94_06415, partial [Bacteriovoracaceae bacterium]|nr:hypothetical protein [Bacteriovoracaceae bacterium]
GNIGTPLCRYALDPHPVDYVILELSSFQLESLREFHPRVAVLLNVVPNHGERYKTLAQYTAAKWQITKNLRGDDTFIFPTAFASLAQSLPCAKVAVDLADAALTEKLAADWDLSSFKLVGRHNLLNLYFCTQVLKSLGLRPADAQAALDKFLGVEFRLARVAAALPFVALNDAKSTNWDATLTAVRSVAETNEQQLPLWVIIGGQRRGRGDDLAPRAAELIQAVQKVLLIGDTTEEYFNLLQGRVAVQRAYTLEAAVRHVVGAGFKGILLFSPGLPSFDQYPNYVARGKDFDLLLEKWAAPT